jgi:hypothetical protein
LENNFNRGKRKIVVLICDACGKENRIREINLDRKEIRAIENNNGCYCSKCSNQHRQKGISYDILAGEFFTVYPKIFDIEELKEIREGQKRAKEILERGLRQAEIDKTLPMKRDLFMKLLYHLDDYLPKYQCDNTFKETKRFLGKHDIEQDMLIRWFKQNGAYCDCEVLFNIPAVLGLQ